MKKKALLLLTICILCALNIKAEVYEGSCGDNVNYTLDTETGILTITGTGEMTDFSRTSYVPWNLQKSKIKSVKILDGVVSIGKYAFYRCEDLVSITIPNSVTSINSSSFYGCSSLTSITIPKNITSLESSVFYGCSSLTKITVESNSLVSQTYREGFSFKNMFGNQVKEYIIGNDVTSIGYYAFYGSELTSITIGNSVTSIDSYAFYLCSALTSVTIPASVKKINSFAFYNCI